MTFDYFMSLRRLRDGENLSSDTNNINEPIKVGISVDLLNLFCALYYQTIKNKVRIAHGCPVKVALFSNGKTKRVEVCK